MDSSGAEERLNSPADFDMNRAGERTLGRFFPNPLLT